MAGRGQGYLYSSPVGALLALFLSFSWISALQVGGQNPGDPAAVDGPFGKEASGNAPNYIYIYTVEDAGGLKDLLECPGKLQQHEGAQWGFEVKIHKALLASPFRTMDPQLASFYFIPSYAKCLNDFGVRTIQEINAIFTNVVQQLPYFRPSGGQDHVVVFPSGRGPTLFLDWRAVMPRSVFLVAEPHFTDSQAALAPHFAASRDVVVPGHIRADKLARLLAARRPLAEREYLAAYKGATQGKPWRIEVGKLAKRYPGEVQLEGDYEGLMGNARFCLIPRGQSAWTRRTFETFFSECVPVFLSDHVEMPFEGAVDYSKMTVKWPADRIDDSLVHFLRNVSLPELERAQALLRRVRCLFDYKLGESECSPLGGILAALSLKHQHFYDAPGTFWGLGGAPMPSIAAV